MVENGPYRHVLHPMYSAYFIIGCGFLLLSSNWLVGVISPVLLLVMYLMRVSPEEKTMIERFGEPYRQYMKRTGRFLPRFRVER